MGEEVWGRDDYVYGFDLEMVSQGYTYSQTHQNVHGKYVCFLYIILYVNHILIMWFQNKVRTCEEEKK